MSGSTLFPEADDKGTSEETPTPEATEEDGLFPSPETEAPKPIPYDRFKEVVAKSKAMEQKLQDFEKNNKALTELFEGATDVHGKPMGVVEAAKFSESVLDTFNQWAAQNPAVLRLAGEMSEYINSGKEPDLSWLTQGKKIEMPTQKDERVETLFKERAMDKITTILDKAGVVPQLRTVIASGALQNVDLNDASQTQVIGAIKSFIEAQGWTQEFVTGQKVETPKAKPPTKGPGGAVASKEVKEVAKFDQPKTQKELEEKINERFKSIAEGVFANSGE